MVLRVATGVWAVLVGVVVCLSAHHAQAQLGESTGVGGGEGMEERMEVEMEVEVVDYYDEDDDEYENEEEGGGGGGVEDAMTNEATTPVRWKEVHETYQGCILGTTLFNFTGGGVMFVNLTQVMEMDLLNSMEAACYHLCLIKEPFSYYLTLSPSTRPNETDACGCHQEEELQQERMLGDESSCDEERQLYRVYCGPANKKCYSRASGGVVLSWYLLLASLALLLFTPYFTPTPSQHSWL